ncbi:MAG TPA: hypothetical protein VIQ54_27325 [Polyangia bacterium]
MRKQPSRTACLAIALAAMVGGARVARGAGEADAPAPAGEVAAPAGEVEAAAPPVVEAAAPPAQVEAPAPAGQVYAPAKPETPQTTWYGWQTLIADGAAAGLLGLTLLSSDGNGANVLGTLSFGTYLLGGPIVHWSHGHGWTGFGSLAARVGLPLGGALVGVLIGAAACGSSEDEFIPCPVAFGAVGLLGGMVAAPVVDATIIAREPVTRPAGPPLQALLVPSGDGGKLVVAGRF